MKIALALVIRLVFGQGSNDPVVVGKTFLASSDDPRPGSTAWSLTSHGIAEKLFTVSQHGEIVGQVAESVSKVSEFIWEVTLKSNYYFSDGTAVNAQHVVDCLGEMNEKNPSAQASLGSMTLTVSGDLQLSIESERSTHVMDAVLAEWVFPVYYIDANGNFLFTGPYAVDNFVEGDHIELIPNEYYPEAIERSNLLVKKFDDGYALAAGLETGEVDLGFHLPIDTLSDLRNTNGVYVKSFEVGYHYMAFHNTRKTHMADVRALAGGLGTRSLFPEYTPYFWDESDPHGDQAAAEALLDEAGWTLSDGKRMKDGNLLTIKLVAYPHRPGLVIMQPVIEESLTRLGITVDSVLTSFDWPETQQIIDDNDFDLLMWAQNTLPAGDPLWFLSAFFRSDGGSNHAGFSSAEVDSLLDALSSTEGHDARVVATREVHEAILAEVPVSNLVTPAWHVGLSERMADYEPWGSDYYIIRADLYLADSDTIIVPVDQDTESKSKKSKKSYTLFVILFAVAACCVFFLALALSYIVRRERVGQPVFMPLLDEDHHLVELPKSAEEETKMQGWNANKGHDMVQLNVA